MRPLLFAIKPATPVLSAGLAFVLIALSPSATRADVVLGNLGTADDVNNIVPISSSDYTAVSFTMGSQNYSLTDVQVRLKANVPDTITFQIRDDAGGHPNNVLHTLNGLSITADANRTYTFGTGTPFTLAANETYWLVGLSSHVSVESSDKTKWVSAVPLTNPSGSGATFGQYETSSNSGASWNNLTDATPKFQLNAGAVGAPEPSSLVLTGTVACVAAAVGWRRRARPEPSVVTARSTEVT